MVDADLSRPYLVVMRHVDPTDGREAIYSSHDTTDEANAVAAAMNVRAEDETDSSVPGTYRYEAIELSAMVEK